MKQPPLTMSEIAQLDNYSFGITWSDGVRQKFRLSELQERCPCAQCNVDGSNRSIDKDVRAVNISSVGRYAMKIKFTSGCSNGIYTYALLREFP